MHLDTWEQVEQYLDQGFLQIPNWVFEHVIQNQEMYPKDAFTKGQLVSKSWLLEKLFQTKAIRSDKTIAILGCWIGSLVPFLIKYNPQRIYGIDIDADSVHKSEILNQRYVQNAWQYKGVVADVLSLQCNNMQFETGGELITVKPDVIINTSCEHMSTEWFESCDSDQLIVMQTNDNPQFEGHINTCNHIDEMMLKYPMSKTLFIGKLTLPNYSRLMQIGYK